MLFDDSVAEAYEDVKNEDTETNWLVLRYVDNRKLDVAATGKDFDAFKQLLTSADRGYGYLRIITGDEMNKSAKFALITWISPSCSPLKKARVSTDKAFVKNVIPMFQKEILTDEPNEIREEYIRYVLEKASGAAYGTGI